MQNKKLNFIALVVLFCFMPITWASEVCDYLPGKVICGKGVVDNILRLGLVMLNGTTVTDYVNVTGSLIAHQAEIKRINCLGKLTLDDSLITGSVEAIGPAKISASKLEKTFKIVGALDVTDTTFSNTIDATALEITLQNTQCKNIDMHGNEVRQQKIYLKDYSIVSGDIIFASGNGLVILCDGSEVLGKVIGGRVIKLN
ncbi:MAG: hypothetical protein M1561_05170 [Gammaproteobacteria bacterium]|nr:hypothetical protein [Gammaproteobacteria bacterium]